MSNTQTNISDNARDIVNSILSTLSEPVSDNTKLTVWSENGIVRCAVHALVRYMYCHSINVIPCSSASVGPNGARACRNVNQHTGEIECGYVFAMGIYKYIMLMLDPGYNSQATTFGCGFYHNQTKARQLINDIIGYMRVTFSDPRQEKWYDAVLRIMLYNKRYFIGMTDSLPTSMPDFPAPSMKEMSVISLTQNRRMIFVPMMVTDDSIFEYETTVKQEKKEEIVKVSQKNPQRADDEDDF